MLGRRETCRKSCNARASPPIHLGCDPRRRASTSCTFMCLAIPNSASLPSCIFLLSKPRLLRRSLSPIPPPPTVRWFPRLPLVRPRPFPVPVRVPVRPSVPLPWISFGSSLLCFLGRGGSGSDLHEEGVPGRPRHEARGISQLRARALARPLAHVCTPFRRLREPRGPGKSGRGPLGACARSAGTHA